MARLERALIVGLLAVMAGAVFLDALHRVFSAQEGRLERLLVALAPSVAAGAVRAVVAPLVLALATFGVSYAAIRSTRPEGRKARALLAALGITAGLAAATQLLVRGLPNGLVWSQQMALCLMLWVGLMGASLAARERGHIAFELAGKIWPARLRRPAEWLARVISAGFSLFLAVLAVAFTGEHYREWADSGGEAGLFEAFRVPRFVIYGFLPFPMTVMGLRFLGHGVRAPEEPQPEPPPEAKEATP